MKVRSNSNGPQHFRPLYAQVEMQNNTIDKCLIHNFITPPQLINAFHAFVDAQAH